MGSLPARTPRGRAGPRATALIAPPAAVAPEAPSLAPVALYLHVPFCVSLCPYCDFVVYPGANARGARSRTGAFVSALLEEIRLRADAIDSEACLTGDPGGPVGDASGGRLPLQSVYLGGGTPSLLPAGALEAILGTVQERFGIAPGAEITLEANPGAGERGDLGAAVGAGVTRVSFGAQSFADVELRRLGRRHRAGDIGDAVGEARAAGVASVNLDLLYDVPGQTKETWAASLEAALALAPDHLSLYALTLDDPAAEGLTGPAGDHLPTPRGARRWRDLARRAQDEERAASQYTAAVNRLERTGWRGYEISNWARPGHESRHNLAYWQRLPCEAVGPGAHAFDGRRRRWNAARLDAYVAALDAGRLPPGGAEDIDEATAAVESVMLALRTDAGIADVGVMGGRFAPALEWALAAGLAIRSPDERLRLTTRGRLLSNEIFARLV